MTTCPSGRWLKMMDARMDVDGPSMCRVLDRCRRVPCRAVGRPRGGTPRGEGGRLGEIRGERARAEPGPNAGSPVRLRPGPARGARIAHDIRTTIYSVAVGGVVGIYKGCGCNFRASSAPPRVNTSSYTRASDVKSELLLNPSSLQRSSYFLDCNSPPACPCATRVPPGHAPPRRALQMHNGVASLCSSPTCR